ncbi:hypothetical protein N7G274_005908 [Stereocaulon virgatum]|uniref:Uncharacterized protein n=1 Tax=Stereocaulon virgatum TaxID=373712 RepID=A0ABR4A9F2_9LECA
MASMNVVPKPPTSPRPPEAPPGSPSHMPPNSPSMHEFPRVDNIGRFEHEDMKAQPTNHAEAGKPKIRASKLDWDTTTSKYKIVDSSALPEAVKDLDEHMLVVRARTDKETFEQVIYIDIKSEKLRDVLRVVLRDVRGLSLREDKITLEQNLSNHYVPKLEAYSIEVEESTHDDTKLKHINLMVNYIRSAYVSTTSRDHIRLVLGSFQAKCQHIRDYSRRGKASLLQV